eukprot:TRINITY_DN25658_c0_g1_i1.p1 TRINITY_DN25658_c0_g1~~TRINITY_DN25658_c0_g1_i1.p1  ORF type:complete len:2859 (+),score=594.22 TRINITY_DN25658_c0_g1_i1:75-8651(+)
MRSNLATTNFSGRIPAQPPQIRLGPAPQPAAGPAPVLPPAPPRQPVRLSPPHRQRPALRPAPAPERPAPPQVGAPCLGPSSPAPPDRGADGPAPSPCPAPSPGPGPSPASAPRGGLSPRPRLRSPCPLSPLHNGTRRTAQRRPTVTFQPPPGTAPPSPPPDPTAASSSMALSLSPGRPSPMPIFPVLSFDDADSDGGMPQQQLPSALAVKRSSRIAGADGSAVHLPPLRRQSTLVSAEPDDETDELPWPPPLRKQSAPAAAPNSRSPGQEEEEKEYEQLGARMQQRRRKVVWDRLQSYLKQRRGPPRHLGRTGRESRQLWATVADMRQWQSPAGWVWDEPEAVDLLERNLAAVAEAHRRRGEQDESVVLPIFCYTCILFRPVAYAVWLPAPPASGHHRHAGEWICLQQEWLAVEEATRTGSAASDPRPLDQRPLSLPPEAVAELVRARALWFQKNLNGAGELQCSCRAQTDLTENAQCLQCEVTQARRLHELSEDAAARLDWDLQAVQLDDGAAGLTLHRCAKSGVTVARFDGEQASTLAEGGLGDGTLWLPSGDLACAGHQDGQPSPFSFACGTLPPPGVIEELRAQVHTEKLRDRKGQWTSTPAATVAMSQLSDACSNCKNQHLYHPGLHMRYNMLLADSEPLPEGISKSTLRELLRLKLWGVGKPAPVHIYESLCLQRVEYNGQSLLFSLSGLPKCVSASVTNKQGVQRGLATRLFFRAVLFAKGSDHGGNTNEQQPFWQINTALRNNVPGKKPARLTVRPSSRLGPRCAANPTLHESDPLPLDGPRTLRLFGVNHAGAPAGDDLVVPPPVVLHPRGTDVWADVEGSWELRAADAYTWQITRRGAVAFRSVWRDLVAGPADGPPYRLPPDYIAEWEENLSTGYKRAPRIRIAAWNVLRRVHLTTAQARFAAAALSAGKLKKPGDPNDPDGSSCPSTPRGSQPGTPRGSQPRSSSEPGKLSRAQSLWRRVQQKVRHLAQLEWSVEARAWARPSGAYVSPEQCQYEYGCTVLDYARRLISAVDSALTKVARRGGGGGGHGAAHRITYRGVALVMPAEAYGQDKIVEWDAFSSTSKDQGIANMFANDDDANSAGASVFIIRGFSGVDISRWSRLSREAEILFGPRSRFRVTSSLTNSQLEVLQSTGALQKGFRLYELEQVTALDVLEARLVEWQQRLLGTQREFAHLLNDTALQVREIISRMRKLKDYRPAEETEIIQDTRRGKGLDKGLRRVVEKLCRCAELFSLPASHKEHVSIAATVLHEANRAGLQGVADIATDTMRRTAGGQSASGVLRELKRCGADPNAPDSASAHTALHHAALAAKHPREARLGVGAKAVVELHELGAEMKNDRDDATPLHLAAATGNVQVIKELLELYGCRWLYIRDREGYTPLHYAARRGAMPAVEYIIKVAQEREMPWEPRGDTASCTNWPPQEEDVLELTDRNGWTAAQVANLHYQEHVLPLFPRRKRLFPRAGQYALQQCMRRHLVMFSMVLFFIFALGLFRCCIYRYFLEMMWSGDGPGPLGLTRIEARLRESSGDAEQFVKLTTRVFGSPVNSGADEGGSAFSSSADIDPWQAVLRNWIFRMMQASPSAHTTLTWLYYGVDTGNFYGFVTHKSFPGWLMCSVSNDETDYTMRRFLANQVTGVCEPGPENNVTEWATDEDSEPGYNATDRPWYKKAVLGGIRWIKPYDLAGGAGGLASSVVQRARLTDASEFVIAADLEWDKILAFIIQEEWPLAAGYFLILGAMGDEEWSLLGTTADFEKTLGEGQKANGTVGKPRGLSTPHRNEVVAAAIDGVCQKTGPGRSDYRCDKPGGGRFTFEAGNWLHAGTVSTFRLPGEVDWLLVVTAPVSIMESDWSVWWVLVTCALAVVLILTLLWRKSRRRIARLQAAWNTEAQNESAPGDLPPRAFFSVPPIGGYLDRARRTRSVARLLASSVLFVFVLVLVVISAVSAKWIVPSTKSDTAAAGQKSLEALVLSAATEGRVFLQDSARMVALLSREYYTGDISIEEHLIAMKDRLAETCQGEHPRLTHEVSSEAAYSVRAHCMAGAARTKGVDIVRPQELDEKGDKAYDVRRQFWHKVTHPNGVNSNFEVVLTIPYKLENRSNSTGVSLGRPMRNHDGNFTGMVAVHMALSAADYVRDLADLRALDGITVLMTEAGTLVSALDGGHDVLATNGNQQHVDGPVVALDSRSAAVRDLWRAVRSEGGLPHVKEPLRARIEDSDSILSIAKVVPPSGVSAMPLADWYVAAAVQVSAYEELVASGAWIPDLTLALTVALVVVVVLHEIAVRRAKVLDMVIRNGPRLLRDGAKWIQDPFIKSGKQVVLGLRLCLLINLLVITVFTVLYRADVLPSVQDSLRDSVDEMVDHASTALARNVTAQLTDPQGATINLASHLWMLNFAVLQDSCELASYWEEVVNISKNISLTQGKVDNFVRSRNFSAASREHDILEELEMTRRSRLAQGKCRVGTVFSTLLNTCIRSTADSVYFSDQTGERSYILNCTREGTELGGFDDLTAGYPVYLKESSTSAWEGFLVADRGLGGASFDNRYGFRKREHSGGGPSEADWKQSAEQSAAAARSGVQAVHVGRTRPFAHFGGNVSLAFSRLVSLHPESVQGQGYKGVVGVTVNLWQLREALGGTGTIVVDSVVVDAGGIVYATSDDSSPEQRSMYDPSASDTVKKVATLWKTLNQDISKAKRTQQVFSVTTNGVSHRLCIKSLPITGVHPALEWYLISLFDADRSTAHMQRYKWLADTAIALSAVGFLAACGLLVGEGRRRVLACIGARDASSFRPQGADVQVQPLQSLDRPPSCSSTGEFTRTATQPLLMESVTSAPWTPKISRGSSQAADKRIQRGPSAF